MQNIIIYRKTTCMQFWNGSNDACHIIFSFSFCSSSFLFQRFYFFSHFVDLTYFHFTRIKQFIYIFFLSLVVQFNTISFLRESYLCIIGQSYLRQHIRHIFARDLQLYIFILKYVSIYLYTTIINTNNVVTFISMLWYVSLGCNAGRIDTCVMYNYDVTCAVLQQSQVSAIHYQGLIRLWYTFVCTLGTLILSRNVTASVILLIVLLLFYSLYSVYTYVMYVHIYVYIYVYNVYNVYIYAAS